MGATTREDMTTPTPVGTPAEPLKDTNPKSKFGAAKPQLHLVPSTAVEAMAGAFALGAVKYGPYNWREKTVSFTTYISAAKRHIDAILEGQDLDPESGKPHTGHAMACLAIIEDARRFSNIIDDRPPGLYSTGVAAKCGLKTSFAAEEPKSETPTGAHFPAGQSRADRERDATGVLRNT